MDAHFSRISCWIYNRPVPPMPVDAIVYYESSWDVQTNTYIKENLDKINTALSTYPSGHCYFKMFYVPQPTIQVFGTEEEKLQELERKAAMYHEATSPFEGIISCALLQDKGHEDYTSQRVMTFNVEDCKPHAILTAIRYMAKLADQFKDDVLKGTGSIPAKFRQMWQVDLAAECKDLYNSAYGWLEGKNEMYFAQTILKYDEKTHRLWFVDGKGNMDEEFGNHDLLSQAFYLLEWNHPEGVKDSDLYYQPNDDDPPKERVKTLRNEFVKYYRVINNKKTIEEAQDHVDFFCKEECRDVRNIARSRIKKSFFIHEKNRVNELFAQKVAEYYSFGANGIIKVINRSTTIILPDSLMSDRLRNYNAEQAEKEGNADSKS